jgi:TonB family protein
MKRIVTLTFFLLTAVAFAKPPLVGPHGEPAKEVAIYAPKPDYPESLRKRHLGGAGVFVLHVNTETGLVSSIEAKQSTGIPLLDASCKSAFMRWRFKPHIVAPRVVIPVSFNSSQQ